MTWSILDFRFLILDWGAVACEIRLFRRVWRVRLARLVGLVRSILETVPSMMFSMYLPQSPASLLLGLRSRTPLAFATKSFLPSGETTTEVGYQPTGI